jgi:hypothetical protein
MTYAEVAVLAPIPRAAGAPQKPARPSRSCPAHRRRAPPRTKGTRPSSGRRRSLPRRPSRRSGLMNWYRPGESTRPGRSCRKHCFGERPRQEGCLPVRIFLIEAVSERMAPGALPGSPRRRRSPKPDGCPWPDARSAWPTLECPVPLPRGLPWTVTRSHVASS